MCYCRVLGGGVPSGARYPCNSVAPTPILGHCCCCCRANMAHIRQSRPGSGLGFQVRVLKSFQVGASSLGSGRWGGGAPECRVGGALGKSIPCTGVPRIFPVQGYLARQQPAGVALSGRRQEQSAGGEVSVHRVTSLTRKCTSLGPRA